MPTVGIPAGMPQLGAVLSRIAIEMVRVRVLLPSSAAFRGAGRTGLPPRPAIEVRLAPTPLPELMIVDSRTAVVGTADKMVPTSDTAAVAPLQALFNSVWDLSMAPDEPFRNVCGTDGEVLAYLRDGWTDEGAARQIGISVRTYRRYVAKMMDRVGATSRFQAGVLASQRGLV